MSRRARDRVVVGSYVKVNVSNWTDLILDMGIIGPDKNPLSPVWMYGRVKSVKPNHFEVALPASEQQYDCVKTKVEKVKEGDGPPPFYVVMDEKTIKQVQGLQIPPDYRPADYFDSVEEAQERHAQAVLVQPVDEAAAPDEVINIFDIYNKIYLYY